MKCELCGSDRQNSLLYGEFLTKNRKGVHTHCLYLSSALKQRGKDNEGILGFLFSDIAEERKRVATVQCCYCGKMRANIGCCEKRCHRNFHMICGIDGGAMNQFLCTFRSFCDRHVRKVQQRPNPNENCNICYESLFDESKRFKAVKMIRAPCCKNGWFHKYCLQKCAKTSGYFFKCPLCNDCDKFKAHMSFWGIFVYDKDAEWELVPNAFAELLERPGVCGAEICHNRGGRHQQNATTNPFIYCTTCGSVAIHRNCVTQRGSAFDCDNCKQILLNADSGRESLSSQQQNDSQVNESVQIVEENENLDVDICGSDNDDESHNSTQDDDADAIDEDKDKIRLHVKHRTGLQITDDTEESANECEAKEVILAKSAVKETNTRNCNVNAVRNCGKTVQINCSDTDSDTDSDYSDDEGLVDTFEKAQKTKNLRQRGEIGNRETSAIISTAQTQCSNIHNITSCIAQRTRRKSMGFRPPSLDEPISNSSDDVFDDARSTAGTPKCNQIFEYDDEHEDDAQYESTERTEHKQEEESADTIQDDRLNKCAENPQTSSVKHEKDTYVKNKNEAVNPSDISCIANRTRRRSSIKSRPSSSHNSAVEHKDVSTIPTTSQQPIHKNDEFIYEEGCEYIEIERENRHAPVKEGLESKVDGQLMDYFFHLLSEVKNNKNTKNVATQNSVNLTKVNKPSNDPSNTSCIANRTRRRSIHTNSTQTLNGEQTTEMTSNTKVYQSAASTADISTNDWKSMNSNSTNESFKSSTYFGSTVTTDNNTNTSNEREINDCNASRRDEATTSNGIEQIATKRKSIYDTNIPTKIPVLSNEDSANVCIANRTRRKSVDTNKFKEIYAQSKHTSSITTNVTPTTSNVVPTSIITVSIIDSSPESNCSDIIYVDTPSSQGSTIAQPTTTIGTPSTSSRHLLTQQISIGTSSSNSNNGEKLRPRLLRRSLSIYDEHDYAKPSFGHSPTSSMAHWSNLKAKTDAYIMPRYVRINGKLRRVSTETVLQQQQQANTISESQLHFARSYNLLLHTTNDGHHARSSRTKSSA